MGKWLPDEETVLVLQKELIDTFSGEGQMEVSEAYAAFFLDCAKISAFLMDPKAVISQLIKLNILLEAEANASQFRYEYSKGYLDHKKLLRKVIERELGKLGFHPQLGKATDILDPLVFQSIFAPAVLVKDPGAGPAHGEFIHPIQWLLIAWQQQESSFLSKPVTDIYKMFGEHVIFNEIWDKVLDQEDTQDCRTPDYLLDLLLKTKSTELTLLKILSYSRTIKRERSDPKSEPKAYYEPSPMDKNLLLPRR